MNTSKPRFNNPTKIYKLDIQFFWPLKSFKHILKIVIKLKCNMLQKISIIYKNKLFQFFHVYKNFFKYKMMLES